MVHFSTKILTVQASSAYVYIRRFCVQLSAFLFQPVLNAEDELSIRKLARTWKEEEANPIKSAKDDEYAKR